MKFVKVLQNKRQKSPDDGNIIIRCQKLVVKAQKKKKISHMAIDYH